MEFSVFKYLLFKITYIKFNRNVKNKINNKFNINACFLDPSYHGRLRKKSITSQEIMDVIQSF